MNTAVLRATPAFADVARPATALAKGIVVRALHKSASTFLHQLFGKLSADCRMPFYSVNNGVPNENCVTPLIDHSFCLCPVRDFSPGKFNRFAHVDEVMQIYQIRDPRDMIVSEYFSWGWIHCDADWSDSEKRWRQELQRMSIDDYVLHHAQRSTNPLEQKFLPALSIPEHSPGTVFVKYETMVTNFRRWLIPIIRAFGFRFPAVAVARYAWKYRREFTSSGESLQHKRRITPGDHREKLKPSTIKILNERYAPILERFGYPM